MRWCAIGAPLELTLLGRFLDNVSLTLLVCQVMTPAAHGGTPGMTKRMITSVNRTTLAEAALALIQDDGLDALTMRTLADRTGVKAASLYWHVRDREELLELVADALLARVAARDQ